MKEKATLVAWLNMIMYKMADYNLYTQPRVSSLRQ